MFPDTYVSRYLSRPSFSGGEGDLSVEKIRRLASFFRMVAAATLGADHLISGGGGNLFTKLAQKNSLLYRVLKKNICSFICKNKIDC